MVTKLQICTFQKKLQLVGISIGGMHRGTQKTKNKIDPLLRNFNRRTSAYTFKSLYFVRASYTHGKVIHQHVPMGQVE